jgi:hypothetical protein
MTIYHVGVEDIHFVHAGGLPGENVITSFDPDHPTFRAEWVRCGLRSTWSALGDGSQTFWRGPLDHMSVSSGEFWLTFRINQTSSQPSQTDFLGFNSGAVRRLSLTGRAGQFPILQRHDDGTTDDLLIPPVLPLGTTRVTLATGSLPMFAQAATGRVDVYFNAGSGVFKLYLDRALAINLTGDLLGGMYSEITSYDLLGSASNTIFSEVCWRSDDTRKMVGVHAVWPYGDGVNMQWTGAKEDVDEEAVDESDANYTDTVGLVQEYTVPPLPSGLQPNIIIGAVMLGARMATNTTDEALVIRTGGTDFQSTSYDTDSAIEDRMYIWEENPDTTDPFTQDELNDSEFNIGVAST